MYIWHVIYFPKFCVFSQVFNIRFQNDILFTWQNDICLPLHTGSVLLQTLNFNLVERWGYLSNVLWYTFLQPSEELENITYPQAMDNRCKILTSI